MGQGKMRCNGARCPSPLILAAEFKFDVIRVDVEAGAVHPRWQQKRTEKLSILPLSIDSGRTAELSAAKTIGARSAHRIWFYCKRDNLNQFSTFLKFECTGHAARNFPYHALIEKNQDE